jgi:hypothetical protein
VCGVSARLGLGRRAGRSQPSGARAGVSAFRLPRPIRRARGELGVWARLGMTVPQADADLLADWAFATGILAPEQQRLMR